MPSRKITEDDGEAVLERCKKLLKKLNRENEDWVVRNLVCYSERPRMRQRELEE